MFDTPSMSFLSIKQYKQAGFTPTQVLWLFEEMRFASSGLMVNEAIQPHPDVQNVLEIRTRLKEKLSNIKTPEDIRQYKKEWLSTLFDKDPSSLIDNEEKIALMKRLLTPASNHAHLVLGEFNREELIERVSYWDGTDVKTQMERDLEDSDPDWDDVQAVLDNRTLKWGENTDVKDPSSSLALAHKKLQQALQSTGVGLVSWPFVHQDDIEVIDKIRVGLIEANQDLVSRFGLKKNTPLLGMNGGAGIALGFEDDNGGTCYTNKGFSVLNLHASEGWRVLAHEWFHGFDGWVGHSMGIDGFISHFNGSEEQLSDDAKTQLKTWRQLIKGLRADQESEHHAQLWEELEETWVERWSEGMPHLKKEVAHEAKKMKSQDWSAKKASKRWTEIFEEHQRPNAYLAAQMLVGELELIREHSAFTQKTPSYMFRRQFDKRIKGDKEHDWAIGYFDEPCELLAHNFESGFTKTSRFVDAVAGETTLRYPLKSEATQQQLFWRRFFQGIKPSLEQHLSPKPLSSQKQLEWGNMRDKIAASRNLSSSSNTVSPSTPSTP